MARSKRTSEALDIARQRLAAMKEMTPKPDFGPGLTMESYEAKVNQFIAGQDAYNGLVSALDDKTNQLDADEQELADLNLRVLAAVKAIYGPDSSEYEQMGGKRRRDRKKPARTVKALKPQTA